MKPTKVRIEAVAQKAGVSPTAVSFAFNNPHRLNAQTVVRILDAARDLGYSPNPHARALLAKSIGVIGILTPQSLPSIFANPFFAAFHEGVGSVCDQHNLSLLTISSVSGSLAQASANAPVDGLIVVGLDEPHPEIEVLHRRKMPFVIVDGNATVAPSVNVDDEGGAYAAAAFLLERGHREIACLTFERDYSATHHDKVYGVGQRRLEGYKHAFHDHEVPWQDKLLTPTVASIAAGEEAFHRLWGQRNRPTAVLAVADIIAIGILQAAVASGVRVPDDLAIIGFDDIPHAAWTTPPLTTVYQPIMDKGEIATQQLLSLIAGEIPAELNIQLPTTLIIRQSA
jgi:DNA-binding LacI/PurR family transcriptional regulator